MINGNLFNDKSSGGPTMVTWGKGDNKSFEKYNTPAELAAAKNPSWRNAAVGTSTLIEKMTAAVAANASTAVPLPSDIAKAMGLAAGARVLGYRG